MAQSRITAVLGPTNTGKTHYAIERMLAHRTGVICLPLRLLAREVYDRLVAARGPSVVALVTGEERIVPERVAYWVCTTEAMPDGALADFLAVDEIQLCADPERGHVFTDRLLNARGLHETLFLGAETMRGAIAALVPESRFERRERLSTLSWAGSRKTSRMPARSAIVGFSVDNVYAIAELLRRQKGGAAVVMGALSPRTRNAQVELYQSGEVDYLVATDAIGMGLNLDIGHVAFSATAKFDGRRMRPLFPHEIGQIAGRAGRHTQPGTFGVTGDAGPLPEGVIEAVENHRFAPIRHLQWRNSRLEFGTVERLIAALETLPGGEWLVRGREADDLAALKRLAAMPEIADRIVHPSDVRLLWDVCRIPDFRSISEGEHVTLLARIFGFLQGGGGIPDDWLAGQIGRIDRTEGDIDALSRRLAFIRTWTYVAQRRGWTKDENHWREATRAVEDRLSDALHGALTQRFVDRRTAVLLRRLKQKESLVAEVNDRGEVTVEGEFAGRLEGFRFRQDATSSPDEARMLARAAYEALRPEFQLRADRFYNAPDTEMDFTEQGGLMWGSSAVGKLVKGADPLRPTVEGFVDEEAGADVAEKVRRRLQHFIDRKVTALFEPLLAMQRDEALTGLARGFAFRLVEELGVLPRERVAQEVRELDQEARGALRRHGVRFGQYTIFQQALLKPAPTRLRLLLWGLHEGLAEFPESPPPGLVTIPAQPDMPKGYYTLSGYHPAGARAIRIDMLERLADILRGKDSRAGFEATPDMLSITGMTLDQFADLMAGLGYRGTRGEREKQRPAPESASTTPAETGDASGGAEPAASDVASSGPAAPEPPAAEQAAAVTEPETDAAGVSTGVPIAPDTAIAELPSSQGSPAHAEALGAALPVEAKAVEDEGSVAETEAVDASAAVDTGSAAAESSSSSEVPSAGEEAAAPEMEVFYSFVWAPRPRGPRGERRQERGRGAGDPAAARGRGRRDGAGSDTAPADAVASGDTVAAQAAEKPGTRHNGRDGESRGKGPRPAGEGKRPQRAGKHGAADGGKGEKQGNNRPNRREEGPRSFEARPPRKTERVDPDSPFAVLAALRDKS